LLGGIFLRGVDRLLPHLHLGFPMEEAEGIRTSWKRTTLFVLAIILHNIPEGLAVDVAFGAAAAGFPAAGVAGAVSLAIGILSLCPFGVKASQGTRASGMGRYQAWWNRLPVSSVQPLCSLPSLSFPMH